MVVSRKGPSQAGVVAESRTLSARDIGKVDSLDMIVCQGSEETERQSWKWQIPQFQAGRYFCWKERLFFEKSSCIQFRRVRGLEQALGSREPQLRREVVAAGGQLGLLGLELVSEASGN